MDISSYFCGLLKIYELVHKLGNIADVRILSVEEKCLFFSLIFDSILNASPKIIILKGIYIVAFIFFWLIVRHLRYEFSAWSSFHLLVVEYPPWNQKFYLIIYNKLGTVYILCKGVLEFFLEPPNTPHCKDIFIT